MGGPSPYRYFLEHNLATDVMDTRGEPYADMVRRPVLLTAVEEDPSDRDSLKQLFEMAWGSARYEEADSWAQRLHQLGGSDRWLVWRLRCLVLGNDLAAAKSVWEHGEKGRSKPLVDDWTAIQLLRDAIFSGWFLTLDDVDFGKLFFVEQLIRRFGKHLKFVSYSLLDRFFHDLLAAAADYVWSRGATISYVSVDDLYSVKNKSRAEQELLERATEALAGTGADNRVNWLRSNPPHMAEMHAGLANYDDDYIAQICAGPPNRIQSVRLTMEDWRSDWLNVVDGKRVTTDQPEVHRNRILLFGSSTTFGFGAEDQHTIASLLQARLNADRSETGYRVDNLGIRGGTLPFTVSNLLQTHLAPGDHVIVFGEPAAGLGTTPSLDIPALHVDFSRPHDHGEVFIDHTHFGWRGNRVVADRVFDFVCTLDSAVSPRPSASPDMVERGNRCVALAKYLLYRRNHQAVESDGMQEYLSYLDEHEVPCPGRVGSVAVNCNPMTLGHLHLLEHAARESDQLYVFVIEEDNAFFSFADRYAVVSDGLAHLDNVTVLRGGRYICTDITFPEYSTKDDVDDVVADASTEAWFFSEFIAPKLGITRIFLGQEPTCRITQQYNDQMERILPRFSIDVEIIPRITQGGTAISASLVRRHLADHRFDLIRDMVPDATYEYLVRKFGGTAA